MQNRWRCVSFIIQNASGQIFVIISPPEHVFWHRKTALNCSTSEFCLYITAGWPTVCWCCHLFQLYLTSQWIIILVYYSYVTNLYGLGGSWSSVLIHIKNMSNSTTWILTDTAQNISCWTKMTEPLVLTSPDSLTLSIRQVFIIGIY